MSDNNDDMWLWLALAACAALLIARAQKAHNASSSESVIDSYAEPQQPHYSHTETEVVSEAASSTTEQSYEQHTEDSIFNPWYLGFRRNSLESG